MDEIIIETEFIKLNQLLKFAGIVQTGVEAKMIIADGLVFVDDEVETKRGRKIYDGMRVSVILDEEFNLIIKKR